MTQDYAGDRSPEESWKILSEDPGAVLLDVRTEPEWAYVGLPDLSPLEKRCQLVCWQHFPAMAVNPRFVEEVRERGINEDQKVLVICRSGVRSRFAAQVLTQAGFKTCYNVATGFEGDHDTAGHRGTVGGWKVAGLPWRQG
jgi:rhodanese-related sulfurtransferase